MDNPVTQVRFLPAHALGVNGQPDPTTAAQSLTTGFVTLGAQMDARAYQQFAVKMRHKAGAAGQTLTFRVQESDDPMDTAEADSVWHTIGAQGNSGGALTEEDWEYTSDVAADTDWRGMPSLSFVSLSRKVRVQVKASAATGTPKALASVGLLPLA